MGRTLALTDSGSINLVRTDGGISKLRSIGAVEANARRALGKLRLLEGTREEYYSFRLLKGQTIKKQAKFAKKIAGTVSHNQAFELLKSGRVTSPTAEKLFVDRILEAESTDAWQKLALAEYLLEAKAMTTSAAAKKLRVFVKNSQPEGIDAKAQA